MCVNDKNYMKEKIVYSYRSIQQSFAEVDKSIIVWGLHCSLLILKDEQHNLTTKNCN